VKTEENNGGFWSEKGGFERGRGGEHKEKNM